MPLMPTSCMVSVVSYRLLSDTALNDKTEFSGDSSEQRETTNLLHKQRPPPQVEMDQALRKEEFQFEESKEETKENEDRQRKIPGTGDGERLTTEGQSREGAEQRHEEEGRQTHHHGSAARQEEEEKEEEDYKDEYETIRDVFRIPPRLTVPAPPRGMPPLPNGCSLSYRTISCNSAHLTQIPPLTAPEIISLELSGKRC